jgi:hypothetical protein
MRRQEPPFDLLPAVLASIAIDKKNPADGPCPARREHDQAMLLTLRDPV